MQEDRDGTFEEIKPFSEFMEKVSKMENEDYENVKAFHFGTRGELKEIKRKKSLEKRFEALENEVNELKSGKKNQSEYIAFPTPEEIKKYSAKGPMERNMLKIMHGISSK